MMRRTHPARTGVVEQIAKLHARVPNSAKPKPKRVYAGALLMAC
jgi:hypothetical protein